MPGARLAVVGAGFIGQEVAATARVLGVDVTIVEALETPLLPILGQRLGRWFARLHSDQGVRVLTGRAIDSARGERRVEELALADGRSIQCDAVVVGVGTMPATDWVRGERPRARRDPHRLRPAAPECRASSRPATPSRPFDPRFGTHARTEHWDAAAWQGAAAAQAMLGAYPGTPPLPSFWSHQYGSRIQYVGDAHHADDVVVEGDLAARDFEAVFTRSGRPIAALRSGVRGRSPD